mmetsp:Transcript_136683/g.241542  ORF Transcript_136683/g.241542 Transcript_136683/m.241542 type:complete len:203 (+) Transcript_136683:172-780(+)
MNCRLPKYFHLVYQVVSVLHTSDCLRLLICIGEHLDCTTLSAVAMSLQNSPKISLFTRIDNIPACLAPGVRTRLSPRLRSLGYCCKNLVRALTCRAPRKPHTNHNRIVLVQSIMKVCLRESLQVSVINNKVVFIVYLQGLIASSPIELHVALECAGLLHELVPTVQEALPQREVNLDVYIWHPAGLEIPPWIRHILAEKQLQ